MGASPQARNVGRVLSRDEASRLSRETGKPISEIAGRAIDKGVGVGSALGNQISRGMSSPTGGVGGNMGGSPGSLEGLRGLQMQKGQAYYGSTTTTTPGRYGGSGDGSSYNPATRTTTPIVLPRGFGQPQRTAPGGASSHPVYGESVDMRQDVTLPPPGVSRRQMGLLTDEIKERLYTEGAASAARLADIYDERSKRDRDFKTRDVVLRQKKRAEDLREKSAAYTKGAEQVRARMNPTTPPILFATKS